MVFPTLPPPLIQDRRTGELLGVRYLGERQVIHALDPGFADVLKNLEALSDGDLAQISSDESGVRWVVSFTHDRPMPWLLPAVTPSGRRVEVLAVTLVTVRRSRIRRFRMLCAPVQDSPVP